MRNLIKCKIITKKLIDINAEAKALDHDCAMKREQLQKRKQAEEDWKQKEEEEKEEVK